QHRLQSTLSPAIGNAGRVQVTQKYGTTGKPNEIDLALPADLCTTETLCPAGQSCSSGCSAPVWTFVGNDGEDHLANETLGNAVTRLHSYKVGMVATLTAMGGPTASQVPNGIWQKATYNYRDNGDLLDRTNNVNGAKESYAFDG